VDVQLAAVRLDAGQPRTSRTMNTARCRGGRCWTATMNASSIVSRATADSSGSIPSGYGCRSSSSEPGSDSPDGTGVRLPRKSRQAFVAIRYSHVRSAAWPLNDSRLFHARRNVSCVTSWASS